MTTRLPGLRLRLPATSANLGPGFDAVGLAMALYLSIDAVVSEHFAIEATGRDAALCGSVEESLILRTYREVAGGAAPPLAFTLHNEIPLGMGCGSSAAALLAGVLLANHFGRLGWSSQQVLEEACRREGHPDNVSACWAGGMTCSAAHVSSIFTATCGQNLTWKLYLALPAAGLATHKARALLPAVYSRADAVANVQSTALLVSAFALGRGDLLRVAMRDRLHQPYRVEVCPLLPRLLPMADEPGVLGVSLSGAGPSILVIALEEAASDHVKHTMRLLSGDMGTAVLETRIAKGHHVDTLT